MWPRFAEIILGCWLVASPKVLPAVSDFATWRAVTFGTAIVMFAAISFLPRLRGAHFAGIGVGLGLLGFAFASPLPTSPAVQNEILVALVLLNFAIIPSHANRPPHSWIAFYECQSAAMKNLLK